MPRLRVGCVVDSDPPSSRELSFRTNDQAIRTSGDETFIGPDGAVYDVFYPSASCPDEKASKPLNPDPGLKWQQVIVTCLETKCKVI